MSGPVLVDTGPLVAFLAAGGQHHNWVCEQMKRLRPPLLTCEPVLTEAAYLLKRGKQQVDPLFALVERGVLNVAMHVDEHLADVRALMRRYRDQPMSLADACMVRLSELHSSGTILTLDADFRVYRRHGNKTIPILMPDE